MSLGKLTDEELAALPEKQQRNLREQPKVLALYRENDFIEAYAKHTALRIAESGYQAAIGGGDNWEEHGVLQLHFLQARGMKPNHRLLDIGCGTGRLARKAAPYLKAGQYVGVDISQDALEVARRLAIEEGWQKFSPDFRQEQIPRTAGVFDFMWAYSVFIHLPMEVVQQMMFDAAQCLRSTGQCLFSYSPEEKSWRSGLKQFRHTLLDYQTAAEAADLTLEAIPDWVVQAGHIPGRWSGGMHIGCLRRKA